MIIAYRLLIHSNSTLTSLVSLIHPSRDPTPAKTGSEAKALGAHGEVRDEVPDEGDELDHRGDEGEEEGLKLEGKWSARTVCEVTCFVSW